MNIPSPGKSTLLRVLLCSGAILLISAKAPPLTPLAAFFSSGFFLFLLVLAVVGWVFTLVILIRSKSQMDRIREQYDILEKKLAKLEKLQKQAYLRIQAHSEIFVPHFGTDGVVAGPDNDGGTGEEFPSGLMMWAQPDLSPDDRDWLLALERVILENLHEFNFTTNTLCTLMGVSRRHLYRRVQELTGLSVNACIKEIRFVHARRLLQDRTYDTVKAVAYSVGFKSVDNFSAQFRERFSKLPSEYLKK